MIYGSNPRGTLQLFKELLYRRDLEKEVKSAYEIVIDTRHTIIEACKADGRNIKRKSVNAKFNKRKVLRTFHVGDEVLLFLQDSKTYCTLNGRVPLLYIERGLM